LPNLITLQWVGFTVLGVFVLLILLVILYKNPDAVTIAVFFFIYSNIAVIVKRFHGASNMMALAFCFLLIFPLMNQFFVKRKKIIIDFPLLLMLGFLFILLLSTFLFAKDLELALDWIFEYLFEGLLLYFLIINVVRNIDTLKRVIWVLLLTGSLLGALTLHQEVTGSYGTTFGGLVQRDETEEQSSDSYNRAAGPVGEKNRYAQIMTILLPLGLFRFWGERSRLLKTLSVLSTVLILSGILFTFSRGAFIAIIGLLVIMVSMRYIKVYQFAIIIAAFVVLTTFAAPNYFGRMNTIRGVKGLIAKDAAVEPDGATRGRLTEMLASLYVFFDYPILGVGPSQYKNIYSVKYMRNSEIAFRRLTSRRRAHCLYTELAAETGIVGLIIFLAIVFSIMYKLWKMERHLAVNRPDLSKMAASLLLSILVYLGTAVFLHLAYQRYYWLLLGLAGAGIQIFASEIENTGESATKLESTLHHLQEQNHVSLPKDSSANTKTPNELAYKT
jgi:O-antigen ligase